MTELLTTYRIGPCAAALILAGAITASRATAQPLATSGPLCDSAAGAMTVSRVPVHAYLLAERRSRAIPAHYGDLILQGVAARFSLPDDLSKIPWADAGQLLRERGIRLERGKEAFSPSFDAEVGFTLHRDGSATEFRAGSGAAGALEMALITAIARASADRLLPVLLDDVSGDKVPLRLRLATTAREAIARRALFEVDYDIALGESVRPQSGNPFPRYPDELQRAGVSGEVLVQFVVDTTGRVEMNTYRALSYSDPAFLWEVTNVVPRLRFKPARVRGCPVRQLVQLPFGFNIRR